MSYFDDIPVRRKLLLAFGALVAISTVACAAVMLNLQSIRSASASVGEASRINQAIENAIAANDAANDALRGLILSGDLVYVTEFEEAKQRSRDAFSAIRNLNFEQTPGTLTALDAAEEATTRWLDGTAVEQLRYMQRPETVDLARAIEVSPARRALAETAAAGFEAMREMSLAQVAEAQATEARLIDASFAILAAATVVMIGAAIAAGAMLGRRVARPLGVLAAAGWVLREKLHDLEFDLLWNRLSSTSLSDIGLSLLCTVAAYTVLTIYDSTAFEYIKRPMRFARIMYVAFVAYAFSHNIGVGAVSGGSVRYRFYSRWGVSTYDIATVIIFGGVDADGYAIGYVGQFTLGMAIGVLVNAVAMPPLYDRETRQQIHDTVDDLAERTEVLADTLRGEWPPEREDWAGWGPELRDRVVALDAQVDEAREARRFNVRMLWHRHDLDADEQAVSALRSVVFRMDDVLEALAAAAWDRPIEITLERDERRLAADAVAALAVQLRAWHDGGDVDAASATSQEAIDALYRSSIAHEEPQSGVATVIFALRAMRERVDWAACAVVDDRGGRAT